MSILKTALTISALSALAACSGTADTEAPADEMPVLEGNDALIASAVSAAPSNVTDNATIVDGDGNVLREGSNGWTCVAETPGMGPACNDAVWMEAFASMQAGGEFPTGKTGVSYMLAGEGDAPGVSNLDPAATEPTADNMWVKEGSHMMLILPDPAAYEGMSSDIADPVYVMWKGTPYAHVMVRLDKAE